MRSGNTSLSPEQLQAFAKTVSNEIPAGRAGTPQEIGDLVVFLASDAGAFVNATDITIDGGHLGVYAGDLQ
ncbi:MAG: SDR family oxidoreductase [Capnocytophaga sp.]|nr:SDR family oxidoreductase [Capnocytophaga sp.]